MKKAFYEISDDKRNRIVDICFEEFSKHSYQGVSLNAILKRANVSKGGMFKYIENKEDLYFYLIELAIKNLVSVQMKHRDYTGHCYVKRVFSLIRGGSTFYRDYKYQYQFLVRASYETEFLDQVTSIKSKVLEEQVNWLLKDCNWDQYSEAKEKVIKYISVLVKGLNVELLSYDMSAQSDNFIDYINLCEEIALKGVSIC